ncbi:hypothetical protein MMC09_006603 [Bachmanniomyces sp. S44760]|nr:hypothetical protein [Bachmanniomyces sp. S44760]
MPFHLSICTESDIPAFVACEWAAFYPTGKIHEVLYPGGPTPDNLAKYAAKRLGTFHDQGITFLKITTEDGEDQKLVAGAKWRHHWSTSRRTKQEESNPEGVPGIKVDWYPPDTTPEDLSYGERFINLVYEKEAQYLKGPHALLDVCFVHPSYQRLGLGDRLGDQHG